jgi:hypothetical protein
MSEHSCGAGCSHGAKAAPSEGTGRVKIQNGKGSAPRNISGTFLKNYDGIKWTSAGKGRKEGSKFVKVY